MLSLKQTLPELGYSANISMFRKFTNVVAGTGAVFAALHVFFGYMGFDKTPNETTGVVPRFLDEPEYLYYLALFCFFTLTVLVSAIFRRLPALSLLPATVTTTYLLLLFDAELLTAGPMTFLLFSLFVWAGHAYISLSSGHAFSRDFFRYTVSAIGLVAAVWSLVLFFRAPGASERFGETLKPSELLDGLWAVWRYERLQVLVQTAEAGNAVHYLGIALGQIALVALLLLLPNWKWLLRVAATVMTGYLFFLVGWMKLSYYPMFFAVPMLAVCVGMLIFCATEEAVTTERSEEPEADAPECVEKTAE